MTFEVAGDAYDRFMGRYSRPLAGKLTDWLEVEAGEDALDVGAGPGAWTEHLVERLGADRVSAIEPSEAFVGAFRERFPDVKVRQGIAESLPYADASFDVAGACLVVHFMRDPVAGIAEMARVTRPGGWVGATVWDLAGRREPMAPVWSALAELAPEHPGEGKLPGGATGQLQGYFEQAGLTDVENTELAVTVTHPTFEEWWEPYLHAVGPIGEVIKALDPDKRERLQATLRERLGAGPFEITAVAFAVRGRLSPS
ncbi:MAG: Methyltransferase type 11 [Nocardioides sp.]|jgi:ubiquinone/menaquinone biosynthesis C-methylase UbiE|uniref:class I SAM-dependent methyltransferase n=1 Tax=Nocardioides sp. TaxID=35761 RepID=UPI002608132F|nr:class I SAM-dependent methyltransferase [Nocardioides sp.]MCW2832845.1 Methyltransferase type 11 [Nocardioides sp.]